MICLEQLFHICHSQRSYHDADCDRWIAELCAYVHIYKMVIGQLRATVNGVICCNFSAKMAP